MLHLKSYVGSIVLAALLLQGCGSSSDETATSDEKSASYLTAVDKYETATSVLSSSSLSDEDSAQITSDLTLKITALDVVGSDFANYIDSIIADNADVTSRTEAYATIVEAMTTANQEPTVAAMQTAGLLETVAGGLANILDSSVGDAVTTAAFDVVLNSEGVTVVMIDLARNSPATSEIMVNAMEAEWSLAEKMCPMLRTSTEFGEKFTALAEEQDSVGRFFFERIDANMYGCLADAMLLSNNDAVHDEDVSHSTNGYMGILMDRYATDYFITPTGSTADRRNDKFVSLLLDTGDKVDYNSTAKTFTGHGDANELTNEKFFYSLFKTPTTTDAFVSAMDKVKTEDQATVTMLMDNIFLGNRENNDTMQGKLNIIAIGSAMYDGIYGVADTDGNRTGAYGFASYAGAFVGFAGLIPGDRYMTYGKAFINAGYEYAGFHGISVWTVGSEAAKLAWNTYTTPAEEATVVTEGNAPARSAGLGLAGSAWYGDISDLFLAAYANFDASISWGALYDAITGDDTTLMSELSSQYEDKKEEFNIAYHTILDGRDENNNTTYGTEITHRTTNVEAETVYGFHGLIELAMQEDLYYVNCGNRSTDYFGLATPTCENNESYTMADANASFQLPPFADITWSYAYGTAKDGAKAYVSTIDADWIADLSTNTLVRNYFYPSADNIYIPNWMLSIDWLTLPANYKNGSIATYDLSFDFNSGYLDVYALSTNPDLLSQVDITVAAGLIKTVTMEKVLMGDDSIIVVGAANTNIDGLHVYKIRIVSPADVEAVLAYLGNTTDFVLNAVGIDTSNTADVDTTVVATAE